MFQRHCPSLNCDTTSSKCQQSNSNHTSMTNYSLISKPFLTSMIETTTNTFNQDSQDTGYQTNNAISTSNNSAQSSSNPSMMIMDTTNNNNNNNNNLTNSDITSNCIFSSVVAGNKKSVNSTPINIDMYAENEKENESSLIMESRDVYLPSIFIWKAFANTNLLTYFHLCFLEFFEKVFIFLFIFP